MKYRVLLVDDERSVKRNLRALIEQEAPLYEVAGEAKDGDEAMVMAESLRPDLIITDIRMPGRDGLQLIRGLMEKGIPAECIILSGYSEFDYAQSAMRYGVVDYVLKPIDPSYFVALLDKITIRLQQRNGQPSSKSEWLWICKTHAERAALMIWECNEQELVEELHRIQADLRYANAMVRGEKREFYTYYLIVLYGELQLLNRSGLPLPAIGEPPQSYDAEEMYRYVKQTLDSLLEQIRSSRNWSHSQIARRAIAYVQEHYKEPDLTLKDAAAYFEISPNYFGNLFKKAKGVSFLQYVNSLRMEEAKQHLENPFAKIYEIGFQVGFEDYGYFSRMFKKTCGQSPSEYRRSMGIRGGDLE